MLLFPTILVTALASSGVGAPHQGFGALPKDGGTKDDGALSLTRLHGCDIPSSTLQTHWALPCDGVTLDPLIASLALMWRIADHPAAQPPQQAPVGVSAAPGGFWHGDLVGARHFGAGPELGWVTPNTPHEDLLRQRLVTPGIGVWYSPLPSQLFVGISANTQVSTLAESWFVNALSSEARIGLTL